MTPAECYLCGHLAVVYPSETGEVGGLCTVEAVVEASVVAVGERHHELPGLLSGLIMAMMMAVTKACETN